MEYLTDEQDCPAILHLPEVFVKCDADRFLVKETITRCDIMKAAQALLTQQLRQTTQPLNHADRVKELAVLHLGELAIECFWVMFLDKKMQLIGFEELFRGTIDKAHVYPRELVKRALELHASSLILVHNHPSGKTEPSDQDRQLTTLLKSTFDVLELDVIDHIIVGGSDAYSFAEHGEL